MRCMAPDYLKAANCVGPFRQEVLPWHRRSSYEPDAPARGVPQSPRWRVGLVCARMRNFLAGVIFREGFQCKAVPTAGPADPPASAGGAAAQSAAFSGEPRAAPLTLQDVNARRQRIARFQEEEEGVTAAKLGRLWSETVKEILVRLFEEKLPFALPSRFAFCLVGSLTRREACPSSDVDAFLLLEVATPKIRDCFFWCCAFLPPRRGRNRKAQGNALGI